MTIAIGVDGSPDAYIFSYSDDSPSVILPSENCTNGTCTDIKLISPDTNRTEYTVSVAARNVVGVGPSSTSEAISMLHCLLIIQSLDQCSYNLALHLFLFWHNRCYK